MRVLALDTSAPRGSMALLEMSDDFRPDAGRLIAVTYWQREKSHSELITPALMDLLAKASWSVKEIDCLLVGLGPGSFTGVRTGINLARTLAFGLGRPVWGTSSLRLWAEAARPSGGVVASLVYGFRDIFYLAVYDLNQTPAQVLLSPQALQITDVFGKLPAGPVTLVGAGWEPYMNRWPNAVRDRIAMLETSGPEAHHLAALLVESGELPTSESWENVKPLYIRGSEAEEKLRHGLLRPLSKV